MRYITALIVFSSVLYIGCAPQQPYTKQTFVLDVNRTAQPAQQVDGIIEVPRFSIVAQFSGTGLVTRTSSVGFSSDFYNEFLVSPERMITGITRTWLSDSGLFAMVVSPDQYIQPDYVLHGTITKLYGDFTDTEKNTAVMELRFTCLDRSQRLNRVVFTKTYHKECYLMSSTAEGLADAYSRCLADILSQLETELAEAL